MNFQTPLIRALLLSSTTSLPFAFSAEMKRAAYDDAGNADEQPHLVDGGSWVFQSPGTPEALQSVAFGDRVVFGYAGVDPKSSYRVKLNFFADAERTLRVGAGKTTLGEIKVPTKTPVSVEYAVPGAAIVGGALTLVFTALEGPNAVVSEVEVLSSDGKALRPLSSAAKEAASSFTLDEIPVLSPLPAFVAGCGTVALDLGGVWKFHPAPPADFAKAATGGWSDIKVPGEWAMQGFSVKPGTAAAYSRSFSVPADWKKRRVMLRCDGVYSDAVVYVNGREAGRHLGGFTPFELDVSPYISASGVNTLTFAVKNDSDADKIASGSQYACHPLGGIPRALRLFPLPEASLASLRVSTPFDADFRDARLELELGLGLAKGANADGLSTAFTLTAPDGKAVPLATNSAAFSEGRAVVSVPVAAPAKWDPSHPHLYTLTLALRRGAETLETVVRKVGFRSVSVSGNRLLVNGVPVKLRGVNHHEVYPESGRSVPAGIDRRDVGLFREANVNLLRTCHYPPTEELIEAADELGMFIECEAPFCWAPGRGYAEVVSRQSAEMVLAYRNHPSVLFWSVANESTWGPDFAASSKLIRRLDPTRPQTFNWMAGRIQHSDEGFTELANIHYPGHNGPAQARKYTKRPVYLGEDSHLNAYNRLELATDPALRDLWGKYLRRLWDDLYSTPGALGQSVWSGVDDTFYMPNGDTVGYGTWGPVDGWRRTKPEYWNLKKAYSPVRILNTDALPLSAIQEIRVSNRSDFLNLSEFKIAWKLGETTGVVESPEVSPGAEGVLRVRLPRTPTVSEKLTLTFTDPRGFVADEFSPAFAGAPVRALRLGSGGTISFSESASSVTVADGVTRWVIDRKTGSLVSASGRPIGGPTLMLLWLNGEGETQMTGKTKVWKPYTEPCSGWSCKSVATTHSGTAVVVTVNGVYDNKDSGAEGAFTLTFHDGVADVGYDFKVTKKINPRQTGLVFTLPKAAEKLSWVRKGYWDVYPADHIARLEGTVRATEGVAATSVGPRTKPAHAWRLDNLPYGNNDFCSTKHNVYLASLLDLSGHGLVVDGAGKTHVRAWRTDAAAFLFAGEFSNGGSERFLGGLSRPDQRWLNPGDRVSGTVRITAP